MADELERIGVRCQDEEAVRRDVAASVVADASVEAFEDNRRLAEALAAVEDAESRLRKLLDLPLRDQKSSYSFEVQAARKELNAKENAARMLHVEVEKKRQDRIDKSKAMEIRRINSAGQIRAPQPAASDVRNHQVQPLQQQPQPKPAPSAPVRILQPYRPTISRTFSSIVPTKVSEVVQEYQGDALLPSLYCAELTSSDKRKMAEKYVDDGSEREFLARQARRETQRKETRQREKRKREEENGPSAEGAVKREEDEPFDELSLILSQGRGGIAEADDDEESVDEEDDDEYEEELVVPCVEFPNYRLPRETFDALLDYQQIGLQWLLGLHHRRVGGILGDEMGLGKTVQIAAFLNALLTSNQLLGPVLIVAPVTVLGQWVAELHKWCPSLRTCLFHATGNASSKHELIDSIRNKPAAVVTTYNALRTVPRTSEDVDIRSANFQYIILDEGHKISNDETLAFKAATSFLTPHRLVLTGSPIQNTLKELWCLFHFVYPGLLGSLENFVDKFQTPINQSRNPRATKMEMSIAVECAKLLKEYIQPYFLRRMKRDVNAKLPAKYEGVIPCSLSDEQLAEYENVLTSSAVQDILNRSALNRMNPISKEGRDASGGIRSGLSATANFGGITESMQKVAFKVLHELRQLCNHADIFRLKRADTEEGASGKNISFRSNKAVNYEGSGKLQTLKKLLTLWKAEGHKVLVFSQTRMMLDIIQNMCNEEKHTHIRMDGNTPARYRGTLVDKFNADDSIFAALLTTKVGGLGVNLTGADRVVIFDPDWNPVNDEQARERAWRIGQTRDVAVYRMISSGTIEETVLHRQLAKTYVTEKVLQDPTLQRGFSMHSFIDAFYLGTEYASRINPLHKSIISSIADIASLEADAELKRENEAILIPLLKEESESGERQATNHITQVLQGESERPLRVVSLSSTKSVKSEHDDAGHSQQGHTQLGILQDMVNGRAVAGPQTDRQTAFLARATARDTLQRALTQENTIEDLLRPKKDNN